jgi:hypothetical protein
MGTSVGPKAEEKKTITAAHPKKTQATVVAGPTAQTCDLLEDVVHEIENLSKAEALIRVGKFEDANNKAYFEMGGVLSVIQRHKWYDPFKTLGEWAEHNTAIKRSTALALIQTYDAVVESGVTSDQVKHIGWTKLRVIARVLTKENVDPWIKLASKQSRAEIIEAVKAHLAPKGVANDGGSPPACVRTFKLNPDQTKTVDSAIAKAKSASGTQHDAAAFEYICLDYITGETLSERLQAVGPAQAGKAAKNAFEDEATLALFMKEIGLEEGLNAVAAAFAGVNIDVSILDPT